MDGQVASPELIGGTPEQLTARLADLLVALGHVEARGVERGRRVADESGQRLEAVLLQLGLVTERGLAEGFASLLGLPLATAADYPAGEPLFAERLGARFLRNAGVVERARVGFERVVRDYESAPETPARPRR